jgi:hypothetical protein
MGKFREQEGGKGVEKTYLELIKEVNQGGRKIQ